MGRPSKAKPEAPARDKPAKPAKKQANTSITPPAPPINKAEVFYERKIK
jgi:hypothetical protein